MKKTLIILGLALSSCTQQKILQCGTETVIVETEVEIGPLHYHWTELGQNFCIYLPPETVIVVDTLILEKFILK
jgi:hypothetical protein